MKDFFKIVLSKFPVFLFCVIFIAAFKIFFGEENSIIGVAVLTTLLIFLKNDLGYDVKYAMIMLPLMMLIVVICPKLASYNPYLGLIINFFSISFLLIFSSCDLIKENHIPFILGYIFAAGYNVSGKEFTSRFMGMLIWAIIISCIYYVVHRNKKYSTTYKDLIKSFDLRTKKGIWYLKLTLGLTIVIFVGEIFKLPNYYWICLTIMSLIHHKEEESRKRSIYRIPCTIIGSVLFLIMFDYIVPQQYHTIMILLTGFFVMLLSSYEHKTIMNAFNALSTAMILFSSTGAVFIRIIDNIIGVAIALISNFIFDKFIKDSSLEISNLTED